LITQRTGSKRAEKAADERATVDPAGKRWIILDMEEALEERLGAADDNPVPAEKQAAQCRDNRDEPDVPKIVIGVVTGRLSKRRAYHGSASLELGAWMISNSAAATKGS